MAAAPISFKIYPYPLTNLTITRVYGGTTQSVTATHSGSNDYYDVSSMEGTFTISADGYQTATIEQTEYVANDVTLVEEMPDNIADAITAAQGRVADCYTAISNKGGTLPVTQNLANMPTAIDSISSGVGIPREVINGVFQKPSTSFTFSLPNNVTDLGYQALFQAFSNSSGVTGADLSSLTTISGDSCLSYTFGSCPNLSSVDVSSIKTVSGSSAMASCFRSSGISTLSFDLLETISGSGALNAFARDCTSLTSVLFPKLNSISGGNVLYYGLYNCSSLTTISFPVLSSISGLNNFYYCFYDSKNIENIYFNGLTTTSFASGNVLSGLMSGTGTTKTHTIHFPSNLQSTISGLTGYPNFGGSSGYVTLAFDLTATS